MTLWRWSRVVQMQKERTNIMIRLATVFSGIGAIEHALQRMQIRNEIVFACDNGDVAILTKKIGMNIDEIGNELKSLSKIIKKIQFNDEVEDLYKNQLDGMLTEALNEYETVLCKIDSFPKQDSELVEKILKNVISMKGVKASRVKEYKKFLAEIGQGSEQQAKLRELQVILEVSNDYKKDNSLDDLGKDIEFDSVDDIDWRSISELVYSAYEKLEALDGKKIIRKVQDLSQRASQLHEKINYMDVQKKLEAMGDDWSARKKYVDSLYEGMEKRNKVKASYMANYNIKDEQLSDLPECFKSRFAQRYIQSLLAKPFVILTGNSGTGKTRISKQFAEYLEVDFGNDEKNWLLIPVGADWTDNTKILGFYNPLAIDGKGEYEKTAILKLIERANLPENKSVPFFIILDEMNLSHVERYFADFLSHMETPDLKFVLDGYPGVLRYPENLFVVGTVNIDETTYMFSPKVLDRANVIEFKPEENSVLDLFVNPADNENINPASDGTAEAFEKMAALIRAGKSNLDVDILVEIQSVFKRIYEIVEKSGYEFAYRTVREIRQYLSAAYELTEDKGTFDFYSIIDEQLIQKILPKIHGNNKEIGGLLEELGALCVEYNLPLSREKIEKMKGKLAQIQYASFI